MSEQPDHPFPTRSGNWIYKDGKLIDLDAPNSLPNVAPEKEEEAVAPPRSGKSRTAPEE